MPTEPEEHVCPHCRFAYNSRGGRCWLCGEPLPPIDEAPLITGAELQPALQPPSGDQPIDIRRPPRATGIENPYAPPSGVVPGSTFALSSLFLIVTLAAVCMGVIGLARGLSVPLVLVVSLALARTLASLRRRQDLRDASAGQKILIFLGSVGMVILVLAGALFAMVIAFFTVCAITIGAPNGGGWLLTTLAFAVFPATLILTIILFRVSWPKRRRD
jgi:hypothetical protein